MILDSEEQRRNLLVLIQNAPINGPWGQVIESVHAIGKLREEVVGASIQQGTTEIPKT